MNPYRRDRMPEAAVTPREGRGDDVAVHLLLFTAGAVPIAIALIRGGAWGVEPSLGLLLCACVAWAVVRAFGTRGAARG